MIARVLARLRALFGARRLALPDPLRIAAQTREPARMPPAAAALPLMDGERDARVLQRRRALVLRLFGANQPVENPRDLFGRRRELDELGTAVLDSGLHAVIHGPRGSGKTSLARVFGDMADERGFAVLYQSCAGESSFGDIILPYLEEIGADPFDMRQDEFATALAALAANPSSRTAANLFSRIRHNDVVLILDEFDRLENGETKAQLALLVKLLADMRTPVRLVFVGISRDVDDLLHVHASVRRHLAAVGVTPIAGTEVESFVTSTGNAIGLDFSHEAIRMIRWLVCGSPYHMRLYSLQASLIALDRGTDRIDEDMVRQGLSRAIMGWRSTNARDSELFEALIADPDFPLAALEAIAIRSANALEFTLDDMVDALAVTGTPPAIVAQILRSLAPALGRMSEDGSRLVFEDVLAPQFLLAMCSTARLKAVAAVREQKIATGGQA